MYKVRCRRRLQNLSLKVSVASACQVRAAGYRVQRPPRTSNEPTKSSDLSRLPADDKAIDFCDDYPSQPISSGEQHGLRNFTVQQPSFEHGCWPLAQHVSTGCIARDELLATVKPSWPAAAECSYSCTYGASASQCQVQHDANGWF